MGKQSNYIDFLRKYIIYCADLYVKEYDCTEEQIQAIDSFADVMLQNLEIRRDK